MITIFEKIDSNNINMDLIEKAAGILRKGGLVAFPTETVYGLGADGLNASACKKIYEAKGRPSDNPLILHIGNISQLKDIVCDIPECAVKIIDRFWPGPVTLVFRKKSIVPDSVSGGLNTVAVRFPSNPVARAIINAAKTPVAAPSANTSGKPSPTRAKHVLHDMDGKIDMIIDGGSCEVGLESTIVDVTGKKPVILRPGGITKEMLEEVVGAIDIDPAVYKALSAGEKPKAPGMKYTHYSPDAEVFLVKGEKSNVAEKINQLVKQDMENGLKTGVMCLNSNAGLYKADMVVGVGKNMRQAGKALFDILRDFDENKVNKVYSEVFEGTGEGMAVMNRLKKAAGYKLIEA